MLAASTSGPFQPSVLAYKVPPEECGVRRRCARMRSPDHTRRRPLHKVSLNKPGKPKGLHRAVFTVFQGSHGARGYAAADDLVRQSSNWRQQRPGQFLAWSSGPLESPGRDQMSVRSYPSVSQMTVPRVRFQGGHLKRSVLQSSKARHPPQAPASRAYPISRTWTERRPTGRKAGAGRPESPG